MDTSLLTANLGTCNHQYTLRDSRCQKCGAGLGSDTSLTEMSGFKSHFFEQLVAVESGSFWFKARNELIQWAFSKYGSDRGNFLEIGCGTGFVLNGLLKRFPHLTAFGSELFPEGVKIARERNVSATVFQMDARSIPFHEQLDFIGAFDVLEHIAEDEQVISQIHGALKENGIFFVTVPQHPWLWGPVDEHSQHCRRYERQELKEKMEKVGFKLELVTSFVTLLLPIMIASRLVRRQKSIEADPLLEFRIASLVTAPLDLIMKLELLLMKIGLRFPVGGSLLAVARKRSKVGSLQ